jgi:hypothetical protein
MLILHLTRPKSGFQGILAVLSVLVAWILVFLARSEIPQNITLLPWDSLEFLFSSPSLLVDETSWFFSLAIISLATALIFTSISQLGHTSKPPQLQVSQTIAVEEVLGQTDEDKPAGKSVPHEGAGVSANWRSWAGILLLTSLGLVAVTAGNMITLLLAWAALDLIELIILLAQVPESSSRERIVLAFSVRMAGIGTVLLAGVIAWSQGSSLAFTENPQSIGSYLLIAAVLRLGVLPLNLPILITASQRRGLGTALRIIPVAASYILLVRVANWGILGASSGLLSGVAAVAGLLAAIKWFKAKDELASRLYWLIGTASLVVISSILKQVDACIAWSIASILSGGLVFNLFIRRRFLIAILLLGVLNFSALPFTPTWAGTDIYQYSNSVAPIFSPAVFSVLSLTFLLAQAILFAGFLRHILREIFPDQEQASGHVEQWVWFVYPVGLLFLVLSHILIGYWLLPDLGSIPITGWIIGTAASLLAGFTWYVSWRNPKLMLMGMQFTYAPPQNVNVAADWFTRLVWQMYRLVARFFSLISAILEGEGGILWALVLFALIFVFLQQ